MSLVRVTAPHFVAGLIVGVVVTSSAPIVRYMVGWSKWEARRYVRRKGWAWEDLG